MATGNQSPSYLEEREKARRFLLETKEGAEATKQLKSFMGPDTSAVLDDDRWTNWGDIVKEHRQDTVIAASCQEARSAFDLARQSSSIHAAPLPGKSKMRRIFSPPMWYVLRKQIQITDPNYWNDPVNIYREALAHPEWSTVSAEYLRGQLAELLPKGEKVIVGA